MKKVLCLFITVCFIMLLNFDAYSYESESLSDMSAEECLNTLISDGLEIPEIYEDYTDLANFVKKIADAVIKNPNKTSWYNYSYGQQFAEDIREAVIKYENLDVNASYVNATLATYALPVNSLTYSKAASSWYDTYFSYNCYAYAIGEPDVICLNNPGYVTGISFTPNDLATMTVDRLAAITSYDLNALGCTSITYSRTLPTYTTGYRIIALKKCTTDYHFMFMTTSSGIWQHKPGQTQILKYNYTSLTSGMWTDEHIIRSQAYSWDTVYDSDIIYIKFKKN